MITSNASFAPMPSSLAAASNALNAGMNGAMLTLAAGVLGSYFRPLNAGQFAFPKLPSSFLVSLGQLTMPAPQAQMTASVGPNGHASIDLGEGYSMKLDENNSAIDILNSNTGEMTHIWGDPHVDVNGKHVFDFAGTTTFQLGNGTKITINTEPWKGNSNAFVASNIVITKGNQAVTVNGISQNKLGDLSVTMGENGYALDAATRDGYTLKENMDGSGWLAMGTNHNAAQADLNATMAGGEYAPGSQALSLDEIGQRWVASYHSVCSRRRSAWSPGSSWPKPPLAHHAPIRTTPFRTSCKLTKSEKVRQCRLLLRRLLTGGASAYSRAISSCSSNEGVYCCPGSGQVRASPDVWGR